MGTLNLGGATLSASGGNWTDAPAGTILQMASASAGPTRQTISSTTPVVITGLSIDFTPRRSDSKIIITTTIVNNGIHVTSFGIYQDGAATASTSGYTNTNQPNMNITMYRAHSVTSQLYNDTIQTTLDAGSTNQRTYDVRGTAAWGGTLYTLYINNRGSNDMASFSHMMIYEVAQ